MGLKHEDESREAVLQLFAQGMTQSDIAKALRIAQSTVSRWCGTGDAEEARLLANLGALERMKAEIEAHAAERAQEHWQTYDEELASWGFEPVGPDCDGHAHGLANGVWRCL